MRRPRRKGQFDSLGSVLGGVLDDLGLEGLQAAREVAEHWEQAVGADIASHSQPVAIRHDTLELEVDSSVWCQQLQLQQREILAALRAVMGEAAPVSLRFRVR